MRKDNVTWKALKLYHSYNKKYFPTLFFKLIFDSISPYFNLWMSAEIVTALYESKGLQTVFTLVAITLLGNLSVHILGSLFNNAVDLEFEKLENNEKLAFNRKTLSLDYDKLENPEIRTLRRKIIENSMINEFGMKYLRNSVIVLMTKTIRVLFSLVFFIEMVTQMASIGFNWIGFCLLFGMIFMTAIQNVLMRYVGKKRSVLWTKVDETMLEENKFGRGFRRIEMDCRIYNQSEIIRKFEEKINKKHLNIFKMKNDFDFKTGIPFSILSGANTLLNYLLICYYCVLGAFPVGSIIKYAGFLGQFMDSFSVILSVFTHNVKVNEPFLKVYLEYFDITNDMYQGSLSVEKRSDKKYDIEFRNVSFKYAGSENYALKNVNLTFKVGERLAVVGMNGSGKTTFIKLMCRLYDPTEGEIYMNDFNVRKYDYRQYLDLFSVVFQDYSLLALPLGNNVSSTATWDGEKAERCLQDVGFGERYAEMAKGLETPIYKNFDDEGVNVSGGEAQKIALARALYKDAPFIILDEPTAALDPIAEAEIYAKFDEIVGDKTAIYISHRLSSCRFCDKIAVFDKGEIVQVGSHEELLADENGKYYELWMAQAQYYKK